jgi:hypothetical protein
MAATAVRSIFIGNSFGGQAHLGTRVFNA